MVLTSDNFWRLVMSIIRLVNDVPKIQVLGTFIIFESD